MPKKFDIAEKRFVVVKKHEVCLLEDGSHKKATFTYSRWAYFVEQFEEIDSALSKVIKKEPDVKLAIHLGGAWYVSVTSGVFCVDIRKFYMTPDGAIKPTREGFAIRVREWNRIKQLADVMKTANTTLAEAQPCWMQPDHYNQEGSMNCIECSPFGSWFTVAK